MPLVIGASMGLLVALYLGAYQLNYISRVWDPFFGSISSEAVVNSSVAKKLPIPDALLGAFAYLLDIIGGSIGDDNRWKSSPWHVVFFGFIVGLSGLTSLFLIIAQPVFLNAWCTLCLTSAAISILLVGPVMYEMFASLQYLQRVRRSGLSVWKAFWGDPEIQAAVLPQST